MYDHVAAGIDRTPSPPSLWTTFVDHRGGFAGCGLEVLRSARKFLSLAGGLGFEPRLTESESDLSH